MHRPPFKLATPINAAAAWSGAASGYAPAGCCDGDDTPAAATAPAPTRLRLGELDPPLHCSVIGTCIGTADLRKLMARFLFVRDSSDLEVHHEAVRLAGQGGQVTKALNKALDQRHAAAVDRCARARDEATLTALWEDALRQGDVPGAYWAVLTHRDVTDALRQRAFGDVHMLSHLVGSANRADIRRLVALEQENAALRDRAERQQQRVQELLDERDRAIERMQRDLVDAQAQAQARAAALARSTAADDRQAELAQANARVALQTERRERAELSAAVSAEEATRLRDELAHLQGQWRMLAVELDAAETQLREIGDATAGAGARSLQRHLQGRRVLYVGGRPSSTPAIRDLVLRHGGEFQHHDGGLEDRKGLLASAVAWAHVVVFPVDCIDHDSAGNLKRQCGRSGIAYLPLRSASVASLAAALAGAPRDPPS